MSTFSAYGMGPGGFRVDRPLDDYEIANRFDIKKAASGQVVYDLSILKFNSTFVECVDRWYSMRGFVAMAGTFFGSAGAFLVAVSTYELIFLGYWESIIIFLLGAAIVWGTSFFVKSDAFTYTHYPIRFNRRNRQVYAFRRDGTVLKAGWEEFVWTIHKARHAGGGDSNVMGHLISKDGRTVKESIALSLVDAGEPGRQNQMMFFEFFRRYMELGPGPVLDALKPAPLIMLPALDRQREGWLFGWQLLTASLKGMVLAQLLFQVFFFPISLFRWVVMRTSKIPQWPQWVEDECRIEPNDPWERDGRQRA